MIEYSLKTIARFWSKVDRSNLDGCWLWTASTKNGYGQFTVSRKLPARYAHRIAWELMNGSIPVGKHVLHSCDMPRCVRHLFLGTHAENMADMAKKGRSAATSLPGEKNPAAKLTENEVVRIKTLRKNGYNLSEIGAAFGISGTQVWRICNGSSWAKNKGS